jgi:hypothetical protein
MRYSTTGGGHQERMRRDFSSCTQDEEEAREGIGHKRQPHMKFPKDHDLVTCLSWTVLKWGSFR